MILNSKLKMNISSSQQSFGTKHLKHPVKSIVYMPPAGIEPATTP
jgi:hypothetical protein